MKKRISLLIVVLLLVSIGTIAILEESIDQADATAEEKEASDEIENQENVQKEIKSLEEQIKEALLTAEQQADLDALPKNPLEAIALVAQKFKK